PTRCTVDVYRRRGSAILRTLSWDHKRSSLIPSRTDSPEGQHHLGIERRREPLGFEREFYHLGLFDHLGLKRRFHHLGLEWRLNYLGVVHHLGFLHPLGLYCRLDHLELPR